MPKASSPDIRSGAPLVDFQPTSRFSRFAHDTKWDVATPDMTREGEAIDVLTGDDMRALPPIGLVAALAVEAAFFGAESTPLIAFAQDEAHEETQAAGAIGDGDETLTSALMVPSAYDVSDAAMLQNFVSYGISFDWTDAMLGYS